MVAALQQGASQFNMLNCKQPRSDCSPSSDILLNCCRSGLTVVTTASPRNHGMLKSLGADAVFDYNASDCGAQIRSYTDNKLFHAFDCIAQEASAKICAEALSSSGEIHYSALLPVTKFPREDVDTRFTMAYTAIGEEYVKFGTKTPAKRDDYEFAKKFWALSDKLVADGKIKPHPVKVGEKGLEGVLEGLQQMREGEYSGVKLVYRTADTPGLK